MKMMNESTSNFFLDGVKNTNEYPSPWVSPENSAMQHGSSQHIIITPCQKRNPAVGCYGKIICARP